MRRAASTRATGHYEVTAEPGPPGRGNWHLNWHPEDSTMIVPGLLVLLAVGGLAVSGITTRDHGAHFPARSGRDNANRGHERGSR